MQNIFIGTLVLFFDYIFMGVGRGVQGCRSPPLDFHTWYW